jgi:hypothetical protein
MQYSTVQYDALLLHTGGRRYSGPPGALARPRARASTRSAGRAPKEGCRRGNVSPFRARSRSRPQLITTPRLAASLASATTLEVVPRFHGATAEALAGHRPEHVVGRHAAGRALALLLHRDRRVVATHEGRHLDRSLQQRVDLGELQAGRREENAYSTHRRQATQDTTLSAVPNEQQRAVLAVEAAAAAAACGGERLV